MEEILIHIYIREKFWIQQGPKIDPEVILK